MVLTSRIFSVVFLVFFLSLFFGCSAKDSSSHLKTNTDAQVAEKRDFVDLGTGPIKSIKFRHDFVDEKMVTSGEKIFQNKCSSCHKLDERYVGPSLNGVTKRRSPEWIMNMILNPDEMIKKNKIAKNLLAMYFINMPFQNISESEARDVLEYFRSIDKI